MKKLIYIGGAVVIIVIVLLVLGVSNLGPIIKTAVNTYAPKITKTDVSLRDVGISIFSGQAKLKDFQLGNPKGFKSSNALSVGSIYVDVDESSLTGDTIIIDKIEITAPEITYEKSASTDNFKALLNNIKSSAATGKSPEKQPEESANGKKIMIRNFTLKDGSVNLATSILGGKSISAALPDIELQDIGKEKGGSSPAEAFAEIFSVLYKKITSPDVTKALNASLKAVTDKAKEQVQQVTDDAKKQVEEASKEAKEQVKKMEEGLKKDLESITGDPKKLFGK